MIGSVEQIYESEQKQTVTREGGQGGSGGGNSPLSRPNDSKEVKGMSSCGMKWRVKCDFPTNLKG